MSAASSTFARRSSFALLRDVRTPGLAARVTWIGALVLAASACSRTAPAEAPTGAVPAPAELPPLRATPPIATTSAALAVGAAAPALPALRWIQGTPLDAFAPGSAQLVVFWAPWSGTSTQVFARLSELDRRHRERGLVVLAVTGPDGRGTTFETARTRVHELGEFAATRIAYDDGGAWVRTWIGDPERPLLPVAFLVDRTGRIAAKGALSEVELRLAPVLAGQHDLAELVAEAETNEKDLARSADLQRSFHAAYRARDWPLAAGICDELIVLDLVRNRRFAFAKFQLLYLETARTDEALAYARELADGLARDDLGMLNALAWTLVDPHLAPPKRDLELAGRCAQRAVDLSLRRNAALLDTLACVHAAQGDLEAAIGIEEEAARLDPLFAARLSEYRARRAGAK
ncbi:MAG: hypothetical protein IPJ77_18865 [Planctomycetes bacterium]|nr:hypothetical protein [Planctomycetota bacterium]